VVILLRKSRRQEQFVLVACNFTPVPRLNYRTGAPIGGIWKEALNSDAKDYGGSGMGNMGEVEAAPVPCHGRRFSLPLTLPPLSTVFLTYTGRV
jgi:1,4-alpha-glucan branching enzyme